MAKISGRDVLLGAAVLWLIYYSASGPSVKIDTSFQALSSNVRIKVSRPNNVPATQAPTIVPVPVAVPVPVQPKKKILSIVLPVTLEDSARLRMMDVSFSRYFDMSGVEVFIVVVRDDEHDAMREKFKGMRMINKVPIRFVKETEIVPEFVVQKNVMGWMKQQIIKLGVHFMIPTDYYMTLDSDIICTRNTTVEDLFIDGKPKTNMKKKEEVSAKWWWEGAEKTLALKVPESEPLRFGVTPAILSTEIMNQFRRYVEGSFNESSMTKYLLDKQFSSFSEYALYYTFAIGRGLFDQYHARTMDGVYREWHLSVWWKDMFDRWDGAAAFSYDRPGYFITMQSNTKIEPERVWEKVRPYLE